MKYLTLYYDDEKYKVSLEKISIVQIREWYICLTFDANNIMEIHENECSNFKEVKRILENL